jgi:hypothetical protein
MESPGFIVTSTFMICATKIYSVHLSTNSADFSHLTIPDRKTIMGARDALALPESVELLAGIEDEALTALNEAVAGAPLSARASGRRPRCPRSKRRPAPARQEPYALVGLPLICFGCAKIFIEQMSGAVADRRALHDALEFAPSGYALISWKLDRLARSMKQLIESLLRLPPLHIAPARDS